MRFLMEPFGPHKKRVMSLTENMTSCGKLGYDLSPFCKVSSLKRITNIYICIYDIYKHIPLPVYMQQKNSSQNIQKKNHLQFFKHKVLGLNTSKGYWRIHPKGEICENESYEKILLPGTLEVNFDLGFASSTNPWFLSWNVHIWGWTLKWWVSPTTMGFPTKNDHFGVFWGYNNLRKHPSRLSYGEVTFAKQKQKVPKFQSQITWRVFASAASEWV